MAEHVTNIADGVSDPICGGGDGAFQQIHSIHTGFGRLVQVDASQGGGKRVS